MTPLPVHRFTLLVFDRIRRDRVEWALATTSPCMEQDWAYLIYSPRFGLRVVDRRGCDRWGRLRAKGFRVDLDNDFDVLAFDVVSYTQNAGWLDWRLCPGALVGERRGGEQLLAPHRR